MAIDTKKLLPHASKANVVSDKSVENISTIASTLIDVDTIMKGSLLLEEMRRKKKAKEDEKKKRSLKERMREGVKSVGKGVVDKAKKVGGSMMDWLNRLVFGMILIGLFKLKDVIMPILPVLAKIVDVVINVAGWIFNAVSTLVHWGYMFVDMIRGFVKNIFGEGGLKVFDNLLGALNTFFNAALMGVMALLKFKWLRNFAKGITKRIGKLIMKIPGVKQAVRKAGVLGKRLIGRGGRKILKSIGQKGLKKTITGGLKAAASKGAAKVGGFAVKIFGKAAKVIGPAFKSAKPFLSKFFGKVPIVGPLIIGIVSLLSGEPAAQALFKAMGAALGGFLGTFIPIPILGTLIGETIGVFVGDLIYKLIFGGGLAAIGKALKDAFKGFFQPILDFFKNGFANFTGNFPTFDVPDIGLQDLYVPIIEKIGLGSLLEFRIPGKVLGIKVPFVPEGGFSLGQMLDSLPKLPDILGWFARFVPGLNTYVEDGRLMRLPQIWQLANPIFMVKHLAQSFMPDMFGGSSAGGKSASGGDSMGSGKESKEEDKGLNRDKLVSYLKFKSAEKAAAEKKKKEEAAAAKEKKKTDMVKNIQSFMALPLDGPEKESPVSKNGSEDKSGSLQEYPSYDEMSPQSALIPLPPQVIPAGDGGSGGISRGSSGGGEDPFESLYAHSGGLA
jgi:hypothetical protein